MLLISVSLLVANVARIFRTLVLRGLVPSTSIGHHPLRMAQLL